MWLEWIVAREERDVADKLNGGDQFPHLALTVVGGDTVELPEDIETRYAIVLFYRGHW